jgi:D-alanyl-D-alanine carboxypeptidase
VAGMTYRLRSAGQGIVKLALVGATIGFFSVGTALAAKSSSIIVDAETGEVLQESNADAPNYPASLTKMMTLYLAFEALDTGRFKLDTELPVSARAAAQAPTKLGLRPGETVAVQNIILGLVTQSANDAAVVMAEGLAGSEHAFAERMTEKAHKLGMRNTFFHNASGLPDPQQRTTARDLVTLARALYRNYPTHYHYFATREFAYRGAVYANHNHLMSSFQGMDGIKTGFINASGFNLAASAVRDNRRLIGVVMGGQSARSRDLHMASLLNEAFRSAPGRIMVAKAPVPTPDDSSDETSATLRAMKAISPVASAEAAPLTPPHKTAIAAAGGWSVQFGAFTKHASAETAATKAVAKLPAAKGKTVQIVAPSKTDKERLYRARLVNLSKKEADEACHVLHRKHLKCSVVAPSPARLAALE